MTALNFDGKGRFFKDVKKKKIWPIKILKIDKRTLTRYG